MPSDDTADITAVLRTWRGGNDDKLAEAIRVVYGELKKFAHAHFSGESPTHTLQTTAVVHELYLKLAVMDEVEITSRGQFFALASKIMRQLITDYARRRKAGKRGGGDADIPIGEVLNLPAWEELDSAKVITIDRALQGLHESDPRASKIAEQHIFSGLSFPEIARNLDLSVSTIKRDWKTARLWLARDLESD